MMNGQYKEKLRTGGELTVTPKTWYIEYYFPGPDHRYNGDFVKIFGIYIDQYITAWINNYDKYLELKNLMPPNITFTATGEMDMIINVGGYWEGVCLERYHMRVKSKSEIDDIVKDYKYAKKQASLVMKILQE